MGGEQTDYSTEAVEAWNKLKKVTEKVDRQFSVSQKVETGKQYAIEHPVITLFALTTLAFCAIPLMCFIFFVAGTLVFVFIGFMFVEGFLLTIGTLFLGGILFAVGFLSLGVSTFIALAWVSARYGHNVINKLRSNTCIPTTFSRFGFFSRSNQAVPPNVENVNGECVKDTENEKDL